MPEETSAASAIAEPALSAHELRKRLGSVFVLGLGEGSLERRLAERAVDDGTSYLRGKAAFERAAGELGRLEGSSDGERIRLRQTDNTPTAAGKVVQAWAAASADRTSLFDERGAKGPTILVLDVQGIDPQSLWSDDDGGPRVTRGGSGASLTLFETAPALVAKKRPDTDNGLIQTLRGNAVSVKRRGNTSRWDRKPNLCVLLDDDGAAGFPKQLNLTNCIRDPAYQRIRLAWSLLGEARCPVQPCAYAELTLNGRHQGTYVAFAPIDHHYFEQWFPDAKERAIFRGQYGDDISGGATLEFRGNNGHDYFGPSAHESERTYETRLHTKDDSYDQLAQFITTLHRVPDASEAAFADSLERVFDVPSFLRAMVVINLLGSWDAYYLNAQNYFLHIAHDPGRDGSLRVGFCPYDQDSVLGVSWPGQKRNWQDKDLLFRGKERGQIPLVTRLLQNPRFKDYYLDFMDWFVRERFTPERIAHKREALWRTLEQSVYLEAETPNGTTFTERPWTNDQVYRHAVRDEQFDVEGGAVAGLQVAGIGKFVQQRRAKVLAQLSDERLERSRVDFHSDDWRLSSL